MGNLFASSAEVERDASLERLEAASRAAAAEQKQFEANLKFNKRLLEVETQRLVIEKKEAAEREAKLKVAKERAKAVAAETKRTTDAKLHNDWLPVILMRESLRLQTSSSLTADTGTSHCFVTIGFQGVGKSSFLNSVWYTMSCDDMISPGAFTPVQQVAAITHPMKSKTSAGGGASPAASGDAKQRSPIDVSEIEYSFTPSRWRVASLDLYGRGRYSLDRKTDHKSDRKTSFASRGSVSSASGASGGSGGGGVLSDKAITKSIRAAYTAFRSARANFHMVDIPGVHSEADLKACIKALFGADSKVGPVHGIIKTIAADAKDNQIELCEAAFKALPKNIPSVLVITRIDQHKGASREACIARLTRRMNVEPALVFAVENYRVMPGALNTPDPQISGDLIKPIAKLKALIATEESTLSTS